MQLAPDGSEVAHGAAPVLAMAETKGGGRLVVCGSVYLADAGIIDGVGYGNKALINALLTEMGAARVPAGIENIQVDRSAIENLTMGEADLFLTITAVVLPALLLGAGFVLLRRRKNH